MNAAPRPRARLVELSRYEALKLLGSAPLGRVAFTDQALPTIRPVNHVMDGDAIVIRTDSGSALLKRTLDTEVVAYEADLLDPADRTGWSVIVTGIATRVSDPADLARYQAMLVPWVDAEMGHVVRIQPDIVSGYRLER